MKSIAVFCGSSDGYHRQYAEQAYHLGAVLAVRGIHVIYGGARVGLMGAVAEGALQHGGRVTGVLPYFLQTKEVAHEGLTELIITDSMHERKMKMHGLSQGIITLPGGWGTMEEMFEILTWGQLGLHHKPVGLLNINGYYDALAALNGTMVQEGFLKEQLLDMLIMADSAEELLERMGRYKAPDVPKWMGREQT